MANLEAGVKKAVKKLFDEFNAKSFPSERKADAALAEITRFAQAQGADGYLRELIIKNLQDIQNAG
jgi:hypothetical protein